MKQIKDDKLLHALLTCGTVKEASVHLGCCQSTIYAKLKEPEFKAQFDELRQEVLKEATNALQVASLDAVAVLRELANDKGANPQSRIYACSQILAYCTKYTEQTEILERLNKLEENCNN